MSFDHSPLVNSPAAQYSLRQRMLCGSLSLAVSGSFSVSSVLAHSSLPTSTFVPAAARGPSATSIPSWHMSGSYPAFPTSTVLHPAVTSSPTTNATSAAAVKGSSTNVANFWHSSKLPVSSPAATPSAQDLELNSSAAIFTAGTLAGFHTISIDIGGKEQQLNVNSRLTAAELVAAQQVLSGGKQEITINAKGIGTGGYFDLNSSTVSALDTAIGGSISSLYVSRGVQAIDTLSNLSLSGSLVNMGTIDLGAAAGSKGQVLDTISAANISNASAGVITSNGHIAGLTATAIDLSTPGTFSNSGKISSASDLSISAPTVNNSGLLSATTGNVKLSGAGGNLTVNGAGGTVQAPQGKINFDTSATNSNVTVSGGNWLSQQVNFNVGSGAIEANVGEVTGIVYGTAGSSHITAATGDLQLGNIAVTGDPTYFNTAGNITLSGTLSSAGQDLSVIASGNIIGNGASLATSGGDLTLVAGANFTSPTTGSSLPPTVSTTAVTIDNAGTTTNGSKTGGYIDLSGVTLTGTATNTPISSVSTSGGNILMVAYKGSGTNSGSIVATETAKQTGGATAVDAGSGSVTMIGGGAQITAQAINGAGGVTVLGEVPVIAAGGFTANTNGSTSGSFVTTPATGLTATSINVPTINAATGAVSIATGGVTSATAKVPLQLTAGSLAFTGSASGSSLYVQSLGGGTLTLNPSSLATGATLSVNAAGGIDVPGNVTAGAVNKTTGFITGGTISLTAAGNIDIQNSAIVSGTTVNLTTSGSGQISSNSTALIYATASTLTSGTGSINVNTAVNTLTIKSNATSVTINESASAGNATSLLASTLGSGGSFTLNSAQPITISGALTATSGFLNSVSLSESGVTTNTTNGTTTVNGITVGAVLNVDQSSGVVNLTTSGNENIAVKTVVLTTPNLNINAAAGVGTSGSGIQTSVSNLLTVVGNSISTINIKDVGTSTFTVEARSSGQESIIINSKAATFVVGQMLFSNVSLTDTVAAASTTLDPVGKTTGVGANTIGDGTGTVIINTAGSISQTSGSIFGNIVTVTSTGGSIGNSGVGQSLTVNAADLTANAVKGSVFLNIVGATTLETSSALNNYQITVAANASLDLAGSVKATLALTGTATLDAGANSFVTQDLPTTFLSAANVTVNAGAGAEIGNGIGFQSIETKAVTALTMTGAANSSMFITQNGSITLATSSTGAANSLLNFALATGGKLTLASTIDFPNLSITAPASLNVNAGGKIQSADLTVTSPIVVVNGSGLIDTSAGSASFVSAAGLSITGAGTITLGSSLSLSGALSITLGNTSGGLNNPLSTIGSSGASGLSSLTIFTTGVFTGAYDQFVLNSGAADTLSITAASFKNSGAFNGGPFLIEANGSASSGANSNSVSFALTSSTNIVLGNTTVTKGAPEYEVVITGTNGGSVSILTGGTLTVDSNGLNIDPASGNSIALQARTLPLTGLSAGNYFSSGKFDSVSLIATSGTFTVGATGTLVNNGIVGNVVANTVDISSPSGITINNGDTIQGAQISLNTSELKMNGAIVGVGSGSIPNPTLSLSNFNGASFTVAPNTTGSYTGITAVTIQATTGSINVGSLFTSSTLLGNSTLDSIAISALAGSVTLPTTLSALSVTSGGTLYLAAGSLSYSPSTKNPQSYLSLDAPNGTITLQTNSAITLGKAHGSIDLEPGTTGAYTVTSKGAIIVNQVLSTTSGSLSGSNITLNDPISATGTLSVLADISRSSNIKSNGFELTANTLIVGVGNPFISSNSTINIDTPNILLVNGGLKLNNTFAGDVNISEQFGGQTQVYAVTLTNSSGLPNSTLTIGSISTTFGNLNIVNTNGNMVVANGANLTTLFGNIYIQNNDLTNGTIVVQPNVTMHGSGVITDLGQIYITMGPAPIVFFSLKGPVPGPDVPLTSSTGGAEIFFTTTSNPLNTITSIGLNSLNASGRNVVFNGAGNNNAITLEGNDVITADPPPVAPVVISASQNTSALITASTASSSITSGLSSAIAAAQSSSGQSQTTTASLSGPNPTLNWSLPTTLSIAGSSLSGEADSALLSAPGGISSGDAGSGFIDPQYPTEYSIQTGIQLKRLGGGKSSAGRLLEGGVSNVGVQTLGHGAKMIAPKEQTSVKTAYGTVDIAAGAVAVVMAFDGGLAVYNFHDTRDGAIVVRTDEQTVKLAPGQNAVFTDKNIHSFEEINPASMVAYRRITAKQWGGGLNGFRSEFSIVSMLKSVDAFSALMRNTKDKDASKVMASVLKTAAILSQLGGEQYQYMNAPVHTAMVPR